MTSTYTAQVPSRSMTDKHMRKARWAPVVAEYSHAIPSQAPASNHIDAAEAAGTRVIWTDHGHTRSGRIDHIGGRYATLVSHGHRVQVHLGKLHAVDPAPYVLNAQRSD